MGKKTCTAERVFEFIVAYKQAHAGQGPAYREIMDGVGLHSLSTVHYHLQRLAAAGELTLTPGAYRSARLPGESWRME